MAARCESGAVPHKEAFSRLKRAIFQDYSYRDLRCVNWQAQFAKSGRELRSSRTTREFEDAAVALLNAAQDVHLWLRVGRRVIPTFRRHADRNVAMKALPWMVPGWRRRSSILFCGQYSNGVFYLCIRAWPGNAARQLEPAYALLRRAGATSRKLIIDVRANGGGSEPLAARFAGCFVDKPVCYAQHLTRRDGGFTGPVKRWLKPNKARPHFSGRVAVLVGPGTVSSCESFAMMMRQAPGCKLIGARTAGSSGNPKPFDLGNGVILFVPSWKDMDLDGHCLEGRGLEPEIVVPWNSTERTDEDPVIQAALQWLGEKSVCQRKAH